MEAFQTDIGQAREYANKIRNIVFLLKESRKKMSDEEFDREMIHMINYTNLFEKTMLRIDTKYGISNSNTIIERPKAKPNMANHLAALKAQELL